jgi:integrase
MDVDLFLASHDYATTTRSTYQRILSAFLVEFPKPVGLSPLELLSYVQRPEWGSSHRYVNLTAIKSFLRWKFGSQHPALVARIKRTGSGRKKRSLSKAQVNTLLLSFDRYTAKGARDLAIAALAIDTGLRLAELVNLRDADTDCTECACYVLVKGGKQGRGVFSAETANHIEHWRAMRGQATEKLFVSTRRKKQSLTREGLQTIVKKWGWKVNLIISPHDFRRTYTRLSLANGASSRTVQLGGRWTNIKMVELYSADLEQDEIREFLPVHNL